MRLRLVSITLALMCMFAGSVFGSVVGKITGEVIDNATKEPLVGVSVAVKGTNMGAMTDENGVYTILNVPVGDYVLVMSTVGYATVELSNVGVSADLAKLPIDTDGSVAIEVRSAIASLAAQHDLTYYDAAYLELALRSQLKLKTIDQHLLSLRDRYDLIF